MRTLVSVLALLAVLLSGVPAFAGKAYVHFFVVDAALSKEKTLALQEFLARTAGGYTLAKTEGAAMGKDGVKPPEASHSYLVSASRPLGGEIVDYLKRNCGEKTVFLLTWEAERFEDGK